MKDFILRKKKAGVILEQDFGYKISEMLAIAVMYVGLEALRGKKKEQESIVSYDMKPEAIYEKNGSTAVIEQVLARKEQLDNFAERNRITIDYVKEKISALGM